MVTAVRLAVPSERLLDPGAADWASVIEEMMSLKPTPIGSQPSEYVITAWKDQPYGLVQQVRVAAAHNGEELFFRLRWRDETKDDAVSDTDQFPDAAAVLLPVKGDAVLQAMGTPEQPVSAWYWRADLDAPLSITATGLGTTAREKNGSLSAAAAYVDDGWQVVIARRLIVRGVFALRPGLGTKVAFAVWQGSNKERAGIKAVTLEWQPLEIED